MNRHGEKLGRHRCHTKNYRKPSKAGDGRGDPTQGRAHLLGIRYQVVVNPKDARRKATNLNPHGQI